MVFCIEVAGYQTLVRRRPLEQYIECRVVERLAVNIDDGYVVTRDILWVIVSQMMSRVAAGLIWPTISLELRRTYVMALGRVLLFSQLSTGEKVS